MTIRLVMNAYGGGGAEKQAVLAATMLARVGNECRVYCLARVADHPRMNEIIREAESAGVTFVLPRQPTGFSFRVLGLLCLEAAMHPDGVVWTWGYRAETVRTWLLSFLSRWVPVVSLRSAHVAEIRRCWAAWTATDFCAPLFISNSRINGEMLEEVLPGSFRRCTVIYNMLEDDALQEPAASLPAKPTTLELVMLGNIRNWIKGYDVAVEVARRAKARGVPFRLRIAGFPHEAEELLRLVREAGVEDVVELCGVHFRPFDFLRSGHVFLLLSRVEGMPNALLEAMSVGLPCISSRVGDVKSFALDGEHVRLVEIGAVEPVVDILEDWLRDWSQARRLGAKAREMCHESFQPRKISRDLHRFFEAIEQRDLVAVI